MQILVDIAGLVGGIFGIVCCAYLTLFVIKKTIKLFKED